MADVRRSAFVAPAADRKLDVVSGKAYTTNQIVTAKTLASAARSPDPAPHRAKTKSFSKGWGFNDPEMKRRKRVATYKVYSMEGKVKASFRKGIRWIKDKCSDLVHGW
ncbi:hypothetical protein H6P81_004069 [Aristolochia fimbriata]|uniref:DUF3511 domain-containing protein n=1 Tax=Aristolochia fimbriata TaxID=158543 RepID=A0AAV7FFF5_ARIFI|nr:hypothetical protein H6P81_004069 [Aristolochia fimbriata]